MKLRVALNGTNDNPYHKMGFVQNPIPQLGIAEYDRACIQLQKLGGDPIPNEGAEEYIRNVLKGWSKEFVDLCIQKYKPGEYVRFTVEFPR